MFDFATDLGGNANALLNRFHKLFKTIPETPKFLMQGTKVNIIVGSHVWAEDPNTCWVDGEVVKINGEEAEIQATNGKKVTCIHSDVVSSTFLNLVL